MPRSVQALQFRGKGQSLRERGHRDSLDESHKLWSETSHTKEYTQVHTI